MSRYQGKGRIKMLNQNKFNVPDKVFGELSLKSVLTKWTIYIVAKMRYCLYKYSIKTDIDAGDIVAAKRAFQGLNIEIKYIVPILEDMAARNVSGIQGIIEAVCGEESCCVQVSRDYFKRLENIDQWNRQDMWNKDISELPKEWTDSESFF